MSSGPDHSESDDGLRIVVADARSTPSERPASQQSSYHTAETPSQSTGIEMVPETEATEQAGDYRARYRHHDRPFSQLTESDELHYDSEIGASSQGTGRDRRSVSRLSRADINVRPSHHRNICVDMPVRIFKKNAKNDLFDCCDLQKPQ